MPRGFSERERDVIRQQLLQAGREQFAAFGMVPVKNAHFGIWAQTEGNTWQYDNYKITD